MLTYRLKKALKALSLEDKREAISYLVQMKTQVSDPDRGEHLLKVMGDTLGETLSLGSRDSKSVWARAMVAQQMRSEGFTTTRIGITLSKDHSSIIHLLEKMQGLLLYPNMYWDIIPIWKDFQNRLNNDTDR